jgi:hypothetical protein
MRDTLRNIVSPELADNLRTYWNLDTQGEVQTMWRNTGPFRSLTNRIRSDCSRGAWVLPKLRELRASTHILEIRRPSDSDDRAGCVERLSRWFWLTFRFAAGIFDKYAPYPAEKEKKDPRY